MSKKTLVIGASLKPNRYSNIAMNKLKAYVLIQEPKILSYMKCYKKLV